MYHSTQNIRFHLKSVIRTGVKKREFLRERVPKKVCVRRTGFHAKIYFRLRLKSESSMCMQMLQIHRLRGPATIGDTEPAVGNFFFSGGLSEKHEPSPTLLMQHSQT
jgi:hypothetical protein